MTVTIIDPNIALIVIDLQQGIVALPTVHRVAEVVARVSALADAFRRHRLPVVLVNVDASAPGRTEQPRRTTEFPAGWTDLLPELNRQPRDHLVTKRTWGAFTNTDLEQHLKRLDVTQVVITHDLDLAQHVGDRLAYLSEGHFRFLGDWGAAERSSDPELGDLLSGREWEEEDDHAASAQP